MLSFWDETQLRLLSTHNLLSERAFAKTTQLKIIELNKASAVFKASSLIYKNNYFNYTIRKQCSYIKKINSFQLIFLMQIYFGLPTYIKKSKNIFSLLAGILHLDFRREKTYSSLCCRKKY